MRNRFTLLFLLMLLMGTNMNAQVIVARMQDLANAATNSEATKATPSTEWTTTRSPATATSVSRACPGRCDVCRADQTHPASIPVVRHWFHTDRNTVQNTGHCIRKRCGQRPGAATTAGGRRRAEHICRHIRCALSA